MIKVIVGEKGCGKTAQLVDDLNAQANSEGTNVVCIEVGQRLDRMVKYKIRLIDITEYPVTGYNELLSFIAGISAKDYDLTHVYIDSIGKITGDHDLANLDQFLVKLAEFSDKNCFSVMIMLSANAEHLPQGIRQYC